MGNTSPKKKRLVGLSAVAATWPSATSAPCGRDQGGLLQLAIDPVDGALAGVHARQGRCNPGQLPPEKSRPIVNLRLGGRARRRRGGASSAAARRGSGGVPGRRRGQEDLWNESALETRGTERNITQWPPSSSGATPIQTGGELPAVGAKAPDFVLTGGDLKDVSLPNSFAGKKKILNIVPSLDTLVIAPSRRAGSTRRRRSCPMRWCSPSPTISLRRSASAPPRDRERGAPLGAPQPRLRRGLRRAHQRRSRWPAS